MTFNRFAQESLEEASVELSSPSSPNSSVSMQVPFCSFTRVLFHKQHASIHLYVYMGYHHMNEMIIHNCLKCLQRVVAPDEPMSSPPTAEPAGQSNKAFDILSTISVARF